MFDCPNCGSNKSRRSTSETYCAECGQVIDDESIDSTEEYRVFDESDKDRKRAGSKITYTRHDKGIGSEMGSSGDLQRVSGDRRGQYYRMRKWDQRSKTANETEIFQFTNNLASELALPEAVAEEAGRLCEKALNENLVKGRNKKAVSASLVYLVARNNEVPRTFSQLNEVVDMDADKLKSTYRYIARELDLGIKPVNPIDLVPSFCSSFKVDGSFRAEVRSVIKQARDDGLVVGRKPASVVGGAMYYVSEKRGLGITQRTLGSECDVTNVTIRDIFNILEDNIGEVEVSVKNEA